MSLSLEPKVDTILFLHFDNLNIYVNCVFSKYFVRLCKYHRYLLTTYIVLIQIFTLIDLLFWLITTSRCHYNKIKLTFNFYSKWLGTLRIMFTMHILRLPRNNYCITILERPNGFVCVCFFLNYVFRSTAFFDQLQR